MATAADLSIGESLEIVRQLRAMAIPALARTYRPDEHLFAFRLRSTAGRDTLEGISRRYTAIALIGLVHEARCTASEVLAGQSMDDVCGRLIDGVDQTSDLGDVALTLWAARALHHGNATRALWRLQAMDPARGQHPLVDLAWVLTALVIDGAAAADSLAEATAARLLASFRESSSLFPHWPAGSKSASLRSHVGCFADQVYPILALSHYFRVSGLPEALTAAQRCADRVCALQGPEGQWWWHYDVRTGRVIEGYPVYAVHQHAMAPMALFALQDACGIDHTDAVTKGLKWLARSPEIDSSLIDPAAGVIWRKVARREPLKITRTAQALASRLHPSLRVPVLDRLARPEYVDYESRPYEMGWILYAWACDRACELPRTDAAAAHQ